MDSSARLTPREEERKESWMEVFKTLGSFEGKFGKASGESSATVVCEVPHLPKADLPMCSCCAQSLAGSKPWEVWLRCKCRMGFRTQQWRPSANYVPIDGDLGDVFSWSSY